MIRLISVILMLALGLGAAVVEPADVEESPALEDGIYVVNFNTDSSMFRINEAHKGKALLIVSEGEMRVHVTLSSKNIVTLFLGKAEDAKAEDALLILPSTDTVTYSDGYTDKVYGFDIPVSAIDQEFDVAIIGKKGKWYDHRVSVSHPVPAEDADTELAETLLLNIQTEAPEE